MVNRGAFVIKNDYYFYMIVKSAYRQYMYRTIKFFTLLSFDYLFEIGFQYSIAKERFVSCLAA